MNIRRIIRESVLILGDDGRLHQVEYARGQIHFELDEVRTGQTVFKATAPLYILSIDGKPPKRVAHDKARLHR